MDKHERWSHLEALLTSALETEKRRLLNRDYQWVLEYIENREYGLAYDHFREALKDQGVIATQKTQRALRAAADLMCLSSPD